MLMVFLSNRVCTLPSYPAQDPAAQAGLRECDIITAITDDEITENNPFILIYYPAPADARGECTSDVRVS